MVAFLIFHAKIGLSTFMEVLSWHIRSLLHALAAVPAQMLAPLALSLRAILSSSSTPVLAWTAVPAQIPAPPALSPRNNCLINPTKKHRKDLSCGVFLFVVN